MVRFDIPKPNTRSMADTQNYGDEVGASSLISPQRFESMGIQDDEFLQRRTRDDVT